MRYTSALLAALLLLACSTAWAADADAILGRETPADEAAQLPGEEFYVYA